MSDFKVGDEVVFARNNHAYFGMSHYRGFEGRRGVIKMVNYMGNSDQVELELDAEGSNTTTTIFPFLDELDLVKPYSDAINPSHYKLGNGVQAIDVIEWLDSPNMGNVVKYAVRAGKKAGNPTEQDINKIIWYANREKKRLGFNYDQALIDG